jgi:hypothetical protein
MRGEYIVVEFRKHVIAARVICEGDSSGDLQKANLPVLSVYIENFREIFLKKKFPRKF